MLYRLVPPLAVYFWTNSMTMPSGSVRLTNRVFIQIIYYIYSTKKKFVSIIPLLTHWQLSPSTMSAVVDDKMMTSLANVGISPLKSRNSKSIFVQHKKLRTTLTLSSPVIYINCISVQYRTEEAEKPRCLELTELRKGLLIQDQLNTGGRQGGGVPLTAC